MKRIVVFRLHEAREMVNLAGVGEDDKSEQRIER